MDKVSDIIDRLNPCCVDSLIVIDQYNIVGIKVMCLHCDCFYIFPRDSNNEEIADMWNNRNKGYESVETGRSSGGVNWTVSPYNRPIIINKVITDFDELPQELMSVR